MFGEIKPILSVELWSLNIRQTVASSFLGGDIMTRVLLSLCAILAACAATTIAQSTEAWKQADSRMSWQQKNLNELFFVRLEYQSYLSITNKAAIMWSEARSPGCRIRLCILPTAEKRTQKQWLILTLFITSKYATNRLTTSCLQPWNM